MAPESTCAIFFIPFSNISLNFCLQLHIVSSKSQISRSMMNFQGKILIFKEKFSFSRSFKYFSRSSRTCTNPARHKQGDRKKEMVCMKAQRFHSLFINFLRIFWRVWEISSPFLRSLQMPEKFGKRRRIFGKITNKNSFRWNLINRVS